MMSPNRVISAGSGQHKSTPRHRSVFLLLILCAAGAHSGRFVTSDFSVFSDTANILLQGNSARIAPRETINVAIFKDEVLTSNTVDSSYNTDVVVASGDTFCFFWAEYNGVKHQLHRKRIVLTQYGYTPLTQEPLYTVGNFKLEFVHGAGGASSASLPGTFYYSLYVHATTGTDSLKFSSISNHSIAHLRNDTFCIVYKESNARLEMRKAKYSGVTFDFADADIPVKTLANNALGALGNFSNSSVAIDSSGNIFITMTRGSSYNPKNLEYLLTNTRYDVNATGNVANNISLNNAGDIQYEDAPVVSYADKKFAAVYWTSAGIYLYTATIAGSPPSIASSNTAQVVAGNTFRAATLTTNGKKLIVAWKNLANNRIEGKVFTVAAGVLSGVPAKTEVFSDAATSIGDHGPELNAVINSVDNFSLSWKQNKNAVGCIWAARGVMHPDARWVSRVDSIATAGDSIVFEAGNVDTVLNKGAVACSLQVGPTDNPASGWSSWLPLGSASALDQNTKGTARYFRYKANFTRDATDSIKSPVLSEWTFNWNLKPRIVALDSVKVNDALASGISGFGDTVDVVSHTDIIDFYFRAHDGDPEDTVFVAMPWHVSPLLAKDTLSGTVDRPARIRIMPGTVWDTVYQPVLSGNDNHLWSHTSQNFTIRSRKAKPVIVAVTFDGDAVTDSSPVNIILGKLITVAVNIENSNSVVWNRKEYRFKTNNFDTGFTTASQLQFRPADDDNYLRIIVKDMFNAADTFMLFFKFPRYATDTVSNPGYLKAKNKLIDSLVFILGADSLDTALLSLKNTGNDTLVVDSLFFKGSVKAWLHIGVQQPSGTVFFDSLHSPWQVSPVIIEPDSIQRLTFVADAKNCKGDSVVYDTLIIHLNDPLFTSDTIPVRLEYDDLPVFNTLSIEFEPGKPYWDALSRKRRLARGYVFPPHAKIGMSFSEPIDSLSAVGNIFAYSIFDSNATGRIDTIHFKQSWTGNHAKIRLKPVITTPSAHFNGLIPPAGTFIPTDSIRVVMTSGLHDKAATPHSPNYLDLDNDFVNDSTTDTAISLRIDSIHFTLDSVSPGVSVSSISPDDSIVLWFSGPIYPGTVDTSPVNNRSLLITTRYNSYINPAKQVKFDAVYLKNNRAVFKPARKYFFGDSVYCYYKGVAIRDSLGYPVDINQNGIPIGFFDSASAEDDYFWSFRVQDIQHDSIFPDSASKKVSLTTPITITFSAPIFPGTIDTALRGNRSFVVTSRYSEGTQLGYDSVRIASNSATFYLNRRLFYSDSVFCDFKGFIAKDTNQFSVDLGIDTVFSNNKTRSWYFIIKDLALESVRPESASVDAGIRTPIAMTFSGPISPVVFDTTTDADSNRTFSFSSAYSGGNRLHLTRITFSPDSATVTINPQKTYYSYDSVNCEFRGFVKNYSYISNISLIPTDTSEVIGAYSWYFITGKASFYTNPNPFKPGSDSRHSTLGGIWFKNLHAIKSRGAVSAVKIKVFNINTHPVFESPIIRFEENNPTMKPEWFWNTKNNKGYPIASGVYFYIIYDTKNKALLKGKILIVR